jgi:major membrane immunogen (membrane-anchored lipoprotein)
VKGVLFIFAVVLLVGGCGSSSKPPMTKTAYVAKMKTIGRSLSTSINGVATVTNPKDAATALGKVQDDLRQAAKDMKALSPPVEIKDQHKKLTQAVSDFADELDPIIEKLNNGKLAALAGVTTLKGFRELQTAAGQITKAGYKIG